MLNPLDHADVSSSSNPFLNFPGQYKWTKIVDNTNEFIRVSTTDEIKEFFSQVTQECSGFEGCGETSEAAIKALDKHLQSVTANPFFDSNSYPIWTKIIDNTNEFIKVSTADEINEFFFSIVRECRGFEACGEDDHIAIKALHDSGATCPEHATVNDFSFYDSIEERQVIEQLCFDGKSMDWSVLSQEF